MNNNRLSNKSSSSIKKNGGMEKRKTGEWEKKEKLENSTSPVLWGYSRVADIKLKLKFYCYQRGLVQHPEICHDLNLAIVNNKQILKYISNLCKIKRRIE